MIDPLRVAGAAIAACLLSACALEPSFRSVSLESTRHVESHRALGHHESDRTAPHRAADPVLTDACIMPNESEHSAGSVTLGRVLESVDAHFPRLIAARREIEIAEGELLAATGGFDATLEADAKLKRGFYDPTTVDVVLNQPLPFAGARVYGGYRSGRGSFPAYDRGLETNDVGELRVGAKLPILRGLAIDARRLRVWKARLRRHAADPAVQARRIAFVRAASLAYWRWVAAGAKLRVARALLEIARTRQRTLEEAVRAGQFGRIVLTDNERIVAQREVGEIAAVRSLEAAGLRLALYLRDGAGRPIVAAETDVPRDFPEAPPIEPDALNAHVRFGLANRPELATLELSRSAARLDLEMDRNRLLPTLDAEIFGSQDFGGAASRSRDKGDFEVGVGLALEIPLLRRSARGGVIANRARLDRVSAELRMRRDEVEVDIRDAASEYRRARERVEVARRTVTLARTMEIAERDALSEGASDLLRVNLRERDTARAESALIDVEASCLAALAAYRAALGLPLAPERLSR